MTDAGRDLILILSCYYYYYDPRLGYANYILVRLYIFSCRPVSVSVRTVASVSSCRRWVSLAARRYLQYALHHTFRRTSPVAGRDYPSSVNQDS